jgi:hypothetical protein
LQNNQLVGSIPTDVGRCTLLRTLWASDVFLLQTLITLQVAVCQSTGGRDSKPSRPAGDAPGAVRVCPDVYVLAWQFSLSLNNRDLSGNMLTGSVPPLPSSLISWFVHVALVVQTVDWPPSRSFLRSSNSDQNCFVRKQPLLRGVDANYSLVDEQLRLKYNVQLVVPISVLDNHVPAPHAWAAAHAAYDSFVSAYAGGIAFARACKHRNDDISAVDHASNKHYMVDVACDCRYFDRSKNASHVVADCWTGGADQFCL